MNQGEVRTNAEDALHSHLTTQRQLPDQNPPGRCKWSARKMWRIFIWMLKCWKAVPFLISPTFYSVACIFFHLPTPLFTFRSYYNPFFSCPSCLTFLSHLLICLPVYTMAHFHSLPLLDCLVCFATSFPVCVYLETTGWHYVSLGTGLGNGLIVLKAFMFQNGFTAVIAGVHLFTTNTCRASQVGKGFRWMQWFYKSHNCNF